MKYIFYVLAFSLLFSACEIVVDLDIPKHEPVLVINSVIHADSVFTAQLSHSVGSFELNDIDKVMDATLSVFQNEVFLGDMLLEFTGMSHDYYDYETGQTIEGDSLFRYALNAMPIVGNSYTYKVSHNSYDDVQATATLPQEVNFISHEIAKVENDYSDSYKLNLTFLDQPGTQYYRLRVINLNIDVFDGLYIEPAYFDTADPSIMSSSVTEGGDPEEVGVFLHDALFNDALFDGEEKTISLEFYDWSSGGDETSSSFYLELSSISKDYFDYLHSYQRQSNYFGGELFAGEPVQVFTNVQNGLGILGASNTKSVKLILPE